MLRTKETALLVAAEIDFDKNRIIFDERLFEFRVGDLDGKTIEEYFKYMATVPDYFTTTLPGGESRFSVLKRMADFVYELETKYANKKILIISHGDPVLSLFLMVRGYTKNNAKRDEKKCEYLGTGTIKELNFTRLPLNEDYELDLHKPYID